MAELTTTYSFSDLYTDVHDYRGSPGDDSSYSTAKSRVNDGYRNFLMSHDWSFLKKTGVITTEPGKFAYDLPDDFRELLTPFVYPSDHSRPPIEEQSELLILDLIQGSGSSTGQPYVCAIRPKLYSEGEGTKWEVIFFYIPSAAYELTYTYRIGVNELVNDDDIPIGGHEHALTLKAFCFAEVEATDDEKVGPWTQRLYDSSPLVGLLIKSIKMDAHKAPRSVGIMGGVVERAVKPFQSLSYNGTRLDNN